MNAALETYLVTHGSMLLADYGADVVKIESPKGREFRAPGSTRDSYFFLSANRGKRSMTLDLRAEGARELLADRRRLLVQLATDLLAVEPLLQVALQHAAVGLLEPGDAVTQGLLQLLVERGVDRRIAVGVVRSLRRRAPLRAPQHARVVGEDATQPAHDPVARAIGLRAGDCAEEGRLQQVLGLGRARGQEHREPQQLVGAASEQGSERVEVAIALEREEQLFVWLLRHGEARRVRRARIAGACGAR